MKPCRRTLVGIILALGVLLLRTANGAETNSAANLTDGWKSTPFKFDVQHPYNLKTADRYEFDPTNNTHHFWVYFTDKPHAPPPNKTTARTEMKLDNFSTGERMFDGDVNVTAGTFACIAQVFDAKHGPVAMLIVDTNGTLIVHIHDLPKVADVIQTHVIGRWLNLKLTNDTKEGGKIHVYIDNVLAGTYPSRGPREYYFKCGVYSRENSARSDVRYRNLKEWIKEDQ